ncbi:MAG TPA: hypothetical protein PLI09_06850 [Candidatus Hydrogenedentes bacterium]|nr:hypothetical protein [Candidatus Hydrogenedentota bacterium]
MKRQARVGLLPLYLKLYDETVPEVFVHFEAFLQEVVERLEGEELTVVRGETCRVEAEVRQAVALFEKQDVDLIITLHLAYSPSLESVGPLCETELPILMLDITMDLSFGPGVDPERIMYNHGIHGVQDLASMLRRHGKHYEIVAGPGNEPLVFSHAANIARAALAAKLFRGMRILSLGAPFKGMGDFSVPEAVLKEKFGITVEEKMLDDLEMEAEVITEEEIEAERMSDAEHYDLPLSKEVHRRSLRVGLGLRKMLERGGYSAFSMNFQAFDRSEGPANTVPFLETSKAMARGIGYAGEGDVLTAALVGALSAAFGRTTFTEIFCPDWEGNMLFLSHMGEINPEVASGRPRIFEKPYPFSAAQNPAVLTCSVEPGMALFVNLAPGPDDSFSLIFEPVDVQDDSDAVNMQDAIRIWVRPGMAISRFLENYSRLGGTHHSALLLGLPGSAIQAFGAFLGLPTYRV